MSQTSNVKWKLRSHLAIKDYHVLMYRAELYGHRIQLEIVIPWEVNEQGEVKFGEATKHFFIDSDERGFSTFEELVEGLKQARERAAKGNGNCKRVTN